MKFAKYSFFVQSYGEFRFFGYEQTLEMINFMFCWEEQIEENTSRFNPNPDDGICQSIPGDQEKADEYFCSLISNLKETEQKN